MQRGCLVKEVEMVNWPIVDVAIGLALVYTLLSLVCSSVQEGIARLGKLRAGTMEKGLRVLLSDPDGRQYYAAFVNHPMIKSFGGGQSGNALRSPAYLPSRAFTQVLLDLVAPPSSSGVMPPLAEIATKIEAIDNKELKTMLQSLLRTASGDIEVFRKSVATWFDDAMDRVSGVYKRRTHSILLALTVIVVAVANADSLAITAALWKNPALAEVTAAAGADYVKAESQRQAQSAVDPRAELQRTVIEMQTLNYAGLPIGWHSGEFPANLSAVLVKLLGLSLTIAAVCLGAPFWFDMLNKLVNIRSTGRLPTRADATPTT